MARNIKPYKKSKSTRVPTDLNSQWFKNATRSIHHTAFDVFKDIMPATSETIVSMKELVPDIRSSYRDTQKKLGVKATRLVNMGKDVWKNSLEDLKSGNLYNQERIDEHDPFKQMDKLMDDMNLDSGFDDSLDSSFDMSISSDDGNAFMEMSQSSSNGNEYTQINVDMNLGEDSTLVQATLQQTEVSVKNSKLASDISTKNVQAIMARLSSIGQIVTSSLSAINDNVSSISTVVSESITANMSVANKYYEDSLAVFTEINEKMTSISDNLTKVYTAGQTGDEVREYKSATDIFEHGGGLNLAKYKDLILRQGKSSFESSMIGVAYNLLKMSSDMGPNKFQYSPIAMAMEYGMKALIPSVVKTALTEVDKQFKETVTTSLVRLGGLRDSANPLLSILGSTFGIRNSKYNVNKENYNKGPMAWNGIAHRTLVDVIPAYLSQIAAAVTGTEQKVFDYKKGEYASLSNIRKEYEEDEETALLSPYMDIRYKFADFLNNFEFDSSDDIDKYREGFNKYIKRIIRDPAHMDFNNTVQTTEAVGGDENIAKMIQQFMRYAPRNMVTAAYGRNALEATANISNRHKEIEADPTSYNGQYINNGLATISGNGSGLLRRDVDSNNRDKFWYLRRILQTINTVVPVRIITGGEDFNLRMLSELGGANGPITDSSGGGADLPDNDTRPSDGTSPQDDHPNEEPTEIGDSRTRLSLDRLNDSPEDLRDLINNASGNNNPTVQSSKILKTLKDLGVKEDSNIYKLMSNIVSSGNRASGGFSRISTKINDSLFSALFSNDPNERGFKGLMSTAIEGLKKQFEKFSTFMDEKVIGPINESLFGDEGFITKLSESDAVKNLKDQISNVKDKATNFLFGEPDSQGVRHNGIFSSTLNSLRDMGNSAKDFIFKDENGVVSSMKKLFRDTTSSIRRAIGVDDADGTSRMSLADRVSNGASDFLTHIQRRGSEWIDLIFGPSGGAGRTELRNSFDTFMGDMKGKSGKLVASSAVGLLGSFFLPGGPITGALLGLGAGIVSESSQLKDFLFGEVGEDGERLNTGLISKDIQAFFKDNKVGMSVGAFAGLASSVGLLPSFFFPGGPIGGALLGGAVSYLHKSGAFNDFIYGEGGTKDNITGGITKFIKDHYKQDANIKSTFLDAGMGAGVGLLGSFFLPGGPITGALLGSAANIAINTDKFKTLMFGEEELDEDGNKTGKRSGGLFGKFTRFMSDNVMTPLKIAAKKTQIKLTTFIEKNMLNPLKASLEPFRVAGKEFMDGVKGVISDIKDAFIERVTKPISDAVQINIIDPMKDAFKNIFSGIGKVVGSIVTAPFKAIQGTAESLNKSQVRRGVSDYNMQETLDRLNRRTDIKQTFAEADIARLEESRGSWRNPFTRRNRNATNTDEQTEISPNNESRGDTNNTSSGETAQSQTSSDSDETTRISDASTNHDAIISTSENTRESTDHLRNIRETIQNILNRISPSNRRNTSNSSDDGSTVVSDIRQSTSMINRNSDTSGRSSLDDNQTTISDDINSRNKKTASKTTEISANVKKIADSVDGQLNGVGYNVNKILKLLLKKNNMSDADVGGENNKKYSRGRKLKNLLLSPVRAIQSMVTGVTTAVKDTVSGIFKGVSEIGKGLLKIPGMIVKTAGSAVKAIGPAITTVVKGTASLIGSGLKAAGSVLQGAAEGLGKVISGASEGFGKLVGGALGGLGNLLHGVGLIGKEVAPVIGKAVGAIIGAPFKLVGAAGGLVKNIFGKKNKGSGVSSHVIVDDILHQTGEERLFDQLKSIESAILSLATNDLARRMPNRSRYKEGDATRLRFPMNIQYFAESSGSNKSNKSRFKEEDATRLRVPMNLQYFAESSGSNKSNKSRFREGDATRLRVPMNLQYFAESSGSNKLQSGSVQSSTQKEQAELATRVSEGSTESLMEKFKNEDSEEKENTFKTKLLGLIQKNNDDQAEHSEIWSSIFSKKGLITGALLLAAPLLIKHLPEIGKVLTGIASTVEQLFAKFFPNLEDQGGVQGAVNGLGEQLISVTDAVGLTDRAEYSIGENGELLTDENGNVVKTTHKDDSALTRISEFYTPTVTKVDHDTGQLYQETQYDGVSAAKLNYTRGLVHKAYKKGVKTKAKIDKNVARVKSIGKKAIDVAETAAIYADDITHTQLATKAYDAVGSAVKGAKTKVSNASSTTVNKIIDLIKSSIKTLSEKLVSFVKTQAPNAASKCGKLVSFLDDIVKKVAKSSVVTKFLSKFTAFFSKASAAAASLATSEVVWGALGFISGATNAGYTFEVDNDDVDSLMIAISSLFRTFLNTSVGSLLDIVAAILYEMTGTNFIANVAVMTYNLIMGLIGQDAKIDKLNDAREKFNQDYQTYQEEEYAAYVKNQESNGETAMSFDDFKASSLATSKSEYNSQRNQSIFKKGFDLVKNGASRVSRSIGKGFNSVKSKVSDTVDNVKTKIKETYDNSKLKTIVNSASNITKFLIQGVTGQLKHAWTGNNDDLVDMPADDDDPLIATKKIVLIGSKVMLAPATMTIRAVRLLYDTARKLVGGVMTLGSSVKTSITGRVSAIWNDEHYEPPAIDESNPLSRLGGVIDSVAGFVLSPIAPMISMIRIAYDTTKGLIAGTKMVGGIIKDSVLGRVSAAIKGEIYESPEIDESTPLGKLRGVVDSVADFVLTPMTFTSLAVHSVALTTKKLFGKFKNLATTAMSYHDVFNDKTTVSNYWEKPESEEDGIFGMIDTLMFYIARSALSVPFYISKALSQVKGKIKEFPGKVLGFMENLFGADGAYNEVSTESGGSGGYGGSAPSNVSSSTMNGFTYYSQNDTRIKNESYNESNGTPGTMGDRGCGPTALSMVATELTGQDYDPTSMARIAEHDGYSTEVGTTTGYFGSVGSRLGLNVTETSADPDSIRTSLANGDPVILQGRNNGSSSPYTSQGHYVVGVGMDGDNILVNDPRGPQYSKGYSMNDIMNGAAGMWSFSGGMGPSDTHTTMKVPEPNYDSTEISTQSSSDEFVKKVIRYIVEGFKGFYGEIIEFIIDKAPDAIQSCDTLKRYLDDIVAAVTRVSVVRRFAQRFSAFFTRLATAASTLASSDIFWGVTGFISGATNAGYTFEVDPDDVDWLMIAISGLFKGILSISWASIVDTVASIIYELEGFNLISEVATMIYNLVMKALGKDDKVKQLSTARGRFKTKYKSYQEDEYNAYVKEQMESGKTPMSFDEFAASSLSTSRAEYNDQQNPSILERGVDAISGGMSGGYGSFGGKGPAIPSNTTISNLPSFEELSKSAQMSPIPRPAFLMAASNANSSKTTSPANITNNATTNTPSQTSSSAAEQAVVNAIYSIKGKNVYSQDNRDHVGDTLNGATQGSGDCSSTVRWAYQTALGIDPGSYTGAQINSPNGYTVESKNGGSPTESNLRPGDLLFYRGSSGKVGHVEMYVGDNKLMGHGSGIGPNEKTMSTYRISDYMGARRFIGEGTNVVSDLGGTTVSGSVPSSDSSDSSSSGFSLSNFISGAISAVQKGIDNFFGTTTGNNSSGTTTNSSPSTGTGAVASVNINPDECARAIWSDLLQKGLTPQGIAGLLGNLHKESGVQSNNLQNSGNRRLGMSDEAYTVAVDNGSYRNFVNDEIGYGLAQWTSAGRKQGLLNLAKSKGVSIGDPTLQSEWLYHELSTDYNGVLNTLKSTNSVYDAAKIVCTDFERPAAKDSPAEHQERANYGQSYYEKLAGSTPQLGGNGKGSSNRTKPTRYKSAAPTKHIGGKGPNQEASSPVKNYTIKSSPIPVSSGDHGNKNSNEYMTKLFEYLGKMVMYMESTSSGITKLNQKDFSSNNNNYMNQSSYTNVNGIGGSEQKSSPDTSNYELGKLIAQGQLF